MDRKRAAECAVSTDAGEVNAAAAMLSSARPSKQSKSTAVADGKGREQLDAAGKVTRLQDCIRAHLKKRTEPAFSCTKLGKSFWMLTDGQWVRPVFSSDGQDLLRAGFYRELQIEDIDASFLTEDGRLVKSVENKDGSLKTPALLWTCIHPVCIRASGGMPWPTVTVTLESDSTSGHHSALTKTGGVVLKSLQALTKRHMSKAHGDAGSLLVKEHDAESAQHTAKYFAIGSALLQQPGAQETLQKEAARQQQPQQPALTPADPPGPAGAVMWSTPNDMPPAEATRVTADMISAATLNGGLLHKEVRKMLMYRELCELAGSGLVPPNVFPDIITAMSSSIEKLEDKQEITWDSGQWNPPVGAHDLDGIVDVMDDDYPLVLFSIGDSADPWALLAWVPSEAKAVLFDAYDIESRTLLCNKRVMPFLNHFSSEYLELGAIEITCVKVEVPAGAVEISCSFFESLRLVFATALYCHENSRTAGAMVTALQTLEVPAKGVKAYHKQLKGTIRQQSSRWLSNQQTAKVTSARAAEAAGMAGSPSS